MTKRTPEPERMLYTVNEFCASIHIGRSLFYKLVREGKIKVVKVGAATRVPVSMLAHVLAHTSSADCLTSPRTGARKRALEKPRIQGFLE